VLLGFLYNLAFSRTTEPLQYLETSETILPTTRHHIQEELNLFIAVCSERSNSDIAYPGHRHGKLFICRPCKERADDLLSRHQLKMVVAILTGHAPVRGQLYTMGLFDGDPTCRFCRKETETVQHIICCCEALVRQRYNVFGNPLVEPKDISTAPVRDLCFFIRSTELLNLY